VTGWNRYLSKALASEGIVRGYQQLERLLTSFAKAKVLPYSSAAADIFEELRKQKVRVATMDMRIASIAIANRMTLLTRNTVDFERIPNLSFDDWTLPPKA
jgi:tRNA(fMet)-specific endonuclease VapC